MGKSLLLADPMSDARSHWGGIVLAGRLDFLIIQQSHFRSNDDLAGLNGLRSVHLAKSKI